MSIFAPRERFEYTIWPPEPRSTTSAVEVNWQEAERRACRFMIRIGFSDATVTPKGADGGVDVASSAAVAQVKARRQRTSRPDVQKLFGVAQAESKQALFFSTSGYSAEAIGFADRNNIALFELSGDDSIEPINRPASELQSAGHSSNRTAGTLEIDLLSAILNAGRAVPPR